MPILGIFASQNYSRITSDYESIATVTVGAGGSSTITFSSIPSTYKHLQVRGITNSTSTADASDVIRLQINSNTSAYANHRLGGNGSVAFAGGATGNTRIDIPRTAASGSGSSSLIYGATVVDILDYTSTNKLHAIRVSNGFETNSQGQIYITSGFHTTDTAAITSLTFSLETGSNYRQYSQFALYGIKG
jgi:hypothetical protein